LGGKVIEDRPGGLSCMDKGEQSDDG